MCAKKETRAYGTKAIPIDLHPFFVGWFFYIGWMCSREIKNQHLPAPRGSVSFLKRRIFCRLQSALAFKRSSRRPSIPNRGRLAQNYINVDDGYSNTWFYCMLCINWELNEFLMRISWTNININGVRDIIWWIVYLKLGTLRIIFCVEAKLHLSREKFTAAKDILVVAH